jgi:RNA polymerase sigma-70 factor (ECF subfamily)
MWDYPSLTIEELVRRCTASGEIGAWEEFVRRFHRLIATVVLRTALRLGDASTQTVDDLIQETYLKLCSDNFRLLRGFDERHPDAFLGYLKVVAANVVRDSFKSLHTQKRGSDRIRDIPDYAVPAAGEDSAGSPKTIEREVLIQEIQRCLDLCVVGIDRERNSKIFWLHYRTGLSAGAIASLPGVGLSTKGVETVILRITRDLRKRLAATEKVGSTEIRQRTEGILPSESF